MIQAQFAHISYLRGTSPIICNRYGARRRRHHLHRSVDVILGPEEEGQERCDQQYQQQVLLKRRQELGLPGLPKESLGRSTLPALGPPVQLWVQWKLPAGSWGQQQLLNRNHCSGSGSNQQ